MLSPSLLALLLLLSCSYCQAFVLSSPPPPSFLANALLGSSSSLALSATTSPDDDISFSKRRESPLGVRRRVKAVLEKAKTRTGIRNSFDSQAFDATTSTISRNKQQSDANIVADAAAIGGLGAVVKSNGTIDVALEYAAPTRNGKKKRKLVQVKDPASTISPVIKNGISQSLKLVSTAGQNKRKDPEVDAINADMPAAVADPLPFTLPRLSSGQKNRLKRGDRIQEQSKMGREGSGYVVVDVKAPPSVVWECLLDFEAYPTTIPTVRGVQFFDSKSVKPGFKDPINPERELRHYGNPSTTRAKFILSKFRLNIAAIHKYRLHPDGDYMVFTLDPECTNVVLKSAKGIWHTETNPDGRGKDWTRVWLICELKVSSLLPSFIVDYAAKRAMPRASSWLKPYVETASHLWLRKGSNSTTST